jgi:AraC-like DNA-binding protein
MNVSLSGPMQRFSQIVLKLPKSMVDVQTLRPHGAPGQVVWQRRLDATRHDLLDGRLAQRSVTEIAFARGFSDLSHFSRRFTQAYGQRPRTFRAATLNSRR